MDGTNRANIKPGTEVDIVLKKDQPTGKLTHGKVKDILTSDSQHHRGIKVRLEDGQVGRVQKIYPVKSAKGGVPHSAGQFDGVNPKFPKLPNGQEYQEGLI